MRVRNRAARRQEAGLKSIGVRRAEIDDRLPQPMRRLIDLQFEALSAVEKSIGQLEAEIAQQQLEGGAARTLREVPGIGLLGTTALNATLGDGSGWRPGREFAASLGLVPAHSGTGGKTRVGPEQTRRSLLADIAHLWRPRGGHECEVQARLARRFATAPAAECRGGGVGQQDGADSLGAGGPRAGIPT